MIDNETHGQQEDTNASLRLIFFLYEMSTFTTLITELDVIVRCQSKNKNYFFFKFGVAK